MSTTSDDELLSLVDYDTDTDKTMVEMLTWSIKEQNYSSIELKKIVELITTIQDLLWA